MHFPTASMAATYRLSSEPAPFVLQASPEMLYGMIKVSWIPNVTPLPSDSIPRGLIADLSATMPQRVYGPNPLWHDETLDWDMIIEPAPIRSSGTLSVSLKFSGRSTPPRIENPWD
jgi:hypothetical protein